MLKKYILSGALVIAGLSYASAQTNAYSGYFLDNFLYRHQLNPAFGNEYNFVGFPGLGNLSIETAGTVHLNKILYPLNGKTVLFTHPDLNNVSKFGNSNKLGANVRENIINVGFKALGGYNTISISAVANSNVAAPGSLLNMLRDGVSNSTYDIKDFMVYANAYAEIALNHSREIKQVPGLRVGATFKFLVGAANAYGKFKKANMNLGYDSWDIVSDGDVYLSGKGLKWETKKNDNAGWDYVSGVSTDNFSAPNGFGAAVDLGATYKWNDFNFSLAILDLGGIAWTDTQKASTNGEQHFQTSDYTFSVDGDDDTFDKMKDQLAALYQLQPVDGNYKRSTMQGTTLNVGVEYELPYYRPLTFGLLNTTRMCGGYTWTEFRLSANVMPVKYVSASANLVCGTYGVGFGWLLNVTSGKGFNLFIGMDRVPGKLSKQYVPLNSNFTFNFGINFPF
ncbi:MAG: hypothetical protein J1E16_01775 [Muribaculaceae bacterium]|nr:hypothetical protein [Muribaculaceae bacterium]